MIFFMVDIYFILMDSSFLIFQLGTYSSNSERGNERKRRKRAGGESRLDGKDENDRGKDGTKRKEGGEELCYNNWNRGNKWKYREMSGRMVRKGDRVKVNVKEAFKINKDKIMLGKIKSWEQKKNIMLNKSKLKEKKRELFSSGFKT
jgi:hypothetical protein